MKVSVFFILIFLLFFSYSCKNEKSTDGLSVIKDDAIQYEPVQLTLDEKQIVTGWLNTLHTRYDPAEKLIKTTLNGYNYHTDATSGIYHEVRISFDYAVGLLDLGSTEYKQRALDIIEKAISLQDQNQHSKSYGVWPYYQEEPLATKKSPVDYNWADFCGVRLLDIWMGHQEDLPETLKVKIKESLILAAVAIKKRNVGPDYTNIAIMGTYVTYMVSHLFGIAEIKNYAQTGLQTFYNYTLDKNGFTEYNSPTYTIEAIDELERMKRHIVEPGAKQIIESLYTIGWKMIARHYHKPSAQWTGPHSRCYSSIVSYTFYNILKQSSDGQISLEKDAIRSDVKIKHKMPTELLSYFLSPVFPCTETDIFEKTEPQIIGNSYLVSNYAFSTANRSCLWNQRRPFLAYWGNIQKPKYLQVRFLHNLYDFSCADIYTLQKENSALSLINFSNNGGDMHISIDRISNGKFKATDLRLRFEFGNCSKDNMVIPSSNNSPFSLVTDMLQFNIQLFKSTFGNYNGHWEKGSDSKTAWVDFVIYSGSELEFDLNAINEAVLGYTFSMGDTGSTFPLDTPQSQINNQKLNALWNGLSLEVPVKPQPEPSHL
jgi:hypothetical protein